jgi:diguanylate cyclase (GGDEF)-like protein/PAS domain S-box-containing protein
MRAELAGSERTLVEATNGLRRQAGMLVDLRIAPGAMDASAIAAARAGLAQAQRQLLGAVDASWRATHGTLDRLLHQRIDRLFQRMWLHLGTSLALLLAILATVTFVARQIARPLKQLSGVADQVRATGNHSLRARWDSADEIGRLVRAFNDMLAQLDREREVQKELAATARAADAQRELVENTPIALVVTAVPGHEVLHANPPAEAWLAGRKQDPWREGLEPAVRARFFQHLADRGAVDEFEVRWQMGPEPSWAVLSARRVRFLGQDAVLTAFAPINHLKLMERRLALWAKVFQNSGEAILIVDADQRVIAANEAFTRHTGYELADMVGDRPGAVFGDALGSTGSLWQTVAQRGTWQGERVLRRRDGSCYPAWLMASAVRQGAGDMTHCIFTSIDITDRKASEERIRFLAEHDVLTELPNRSLARERLREAMQQAGSSGQRVAVLFIDLDRFKHINDSLGHHIGDELLRSVAVRLRQSVRAGDTVSRLGGDEFVVVLAGVSGVDEVTQIVHQRLIPRVREPHPVTGAELHVSCSVGLALFPEDATDLDTLMRHADTAMYEAKAAGKDQARFFAPAMTERAQARLRLEARLRRAHDEGAFRMEWQPRVAAEDGSFRGVEGLLRWHDAELGTIGPAEFVPIAEETGLIVPIGAWVVDHACAQIAAWRRAGLPPFGVSINLSARQLGDPGLVDTVREAMLRHGVQPGQLELELTESVVMERGSLHLSRLHALRSLGVAIAIDDFGTGYSSLAYLTQLPCDRLKIDRSFVHDLLGDPTARAIVRAVVGLGRTLGLTVVAEGVELKAQAEQLRDAGCDELQGYLYSRPMAAAALPGWLQGRPGAGAASNGAGPEGRGGTAAGQSDDPLRTAASTRGAVVQA